MEREGLTVDTTISINIDLQHIESSKANILSWPLRCLKGIFVLALLEDSARTDVLSLSRILLLTLNNVSEPDLNHFSGSPFL